MGLYRGYVGIMEKKIETTLMGYTRGYIGSQGCVSQLVSGLRKIACVARISVQRLFKTQLKPNHTSQALLKIIHHITLTWMITTALTQHP